MQILERLPIDGPSPRTLAWITAAWLGVGVFAGLTELLASLLNGQRLPLGAVMSKPVVAGLCWVPLTCLALWLARQVPLGADWTWRALAANGGVLLAVSFLLNAVWGCVMALSGQMPWAAVPTLTVAGGLRWMHINVVVFAVLLTVANVARARVAAQAARGGYLRTLVVPTAGGEVVLTLDEVAWIGGAGDYSAVHARGQEFLLSERMKTLEAKLDPERFVRIHRSTIVNVDHIREARSLGRGDREVRLDCGTSLRVSRRRRAALDAALEATA